MKVGADPDRDPERVRRARDAIGEDVGLFVDANGAYGRKQALRMAEVFVQEAGASWFEEPVSSDDVEGLLLLRDHAPAELRERETAVVRQLADDLTVGWIKLWKIRGPHGHNSVGSDTNRA